MAQLVIIRMVRDRLVKRVQIENDNGGTFDVHRGVL